MIIVISLKIYYVLNFPVRSHLSDTQNNTKYVRDLNCSIKSEIRVSCMYLRQVFL